MCLYGVYDGDSPLRGRPVGGSALVARELAVDFTPGRKLEEVALVRRVVFVTMLKSSLRRSELHRRSYIKQQLTNHHWSKSMLYRGTCGRLS